MQLTPGETIEYTRLIMNASDMNGADKDRILQVLLQEYSTLKAEQGSRIQFRDNMLYTTIGAVGAIASVGLGGFNAGAGTVRHAFLIVPWLTAILGWTYVVNDEKITAIRRYIDKSLAKRVKDLIGTDQKDFPFGWEHFHRRDKLRGERKSIQLAIDLWTFVISGAGALFAFLVRALQSPPVGNTLYFDIVAAGADFVILLFLARQIIAYWNRAVEDDPKTSKDS